MYMCVYIYLLYLLYLLLLLSSYVMLYDVIPSLRANLVRGCDTVGNPHRAQIYNFELFELF